jgi:DNA-binding MarR family transcriptional regulator
MAADTDANAAVFRTPGYLVSRAARAFARLSEARLRPLGLGVGSVPVLAALREDQPTTQRDLARRLSVEQPPMAQMLSRLERNGLITRETDPDDARSRLVSLSAKAEEALPGAVDAVLKGNADALEGFSRDEREQFVSLLERLIVNLDGLNAE